MERKNNKKTRKEVVKQFEKQPKEITIKEVKDKGPGSMRE